MQGRIKASWKGGSYALKMMVSLCGFLSHLPQIFYENEIIWSHRDQIISFPYNI